MSLSKPKGKRDSCLESLVKTYVTLLHEKPVLTKAVTSGITAGLGNFLSQLRTHGSISAVQWRSVLAFVATGSLFVGPIIHHFYIWLDHFVPKTQKYATLKRIILDRFVFAPPFLLVYFYLIAIFEGQGSKLATEKIKQFYWTTLKMNWKVWTLFQYVNINYVPQQYRVLFANVLSLGWTIYVAGSR